MNLLEVKNMDVSIELGGVITSVIGTTNSGKTTLLKKLCNKIPNNDIYIDDIPISEYDLTFLKNNIVVVLDDNHFNCDYVAEELFFYLNKLGYRIDEITKMIDKIAYYFKIEKLLDQRIELLSVQEKVLIRILSYLIIKPKVLAIDNLVEYLSVNDLNTLIKYIRENNISLINVITNSEYLFLSNNVVIMNNYKAVLCGSVASVIEGNSILPYMGIKLPFVVDLSNNLKLYGLIDKIYLENRKLVDKLWK